MPNSVVPFADPGFSGDCAPRLPLGTPEQVLTAWESCLPAGTQVSAVTGVREQFAAVAQRVQARAGDAAAGSPAGKAGKTSKAVGKGGAVTPPPPDPLPTSVADQYTPAQLTRIKTAITAAASRLRITLNHQQED